MLFRGRTVLTFIIVTLLASCILTFLMIGPNGFLVDGTTGKSDKGAVNQGTPNNHLDADKATELTEEEIAKIETVYRIINSKFMKKLDRQEILDGAVRGMLDVLQDPYTTYMDPVTSEQFEQNVDAFFTGI